MKIEFLGSKGGPGWYTMTWVVSDKSVKIVSLETWYLPIDTVLGDFIEESGLECGTVGEIKDICESVISSLKYCEREAPMEDSYRKSLKREGDEFYLNIYNRLFRKTQKEPLIKFDK